MPILAVLVLIAAIALRLLGGGEPAVTEDTAPFAAAIQDYCKRKHFGMKIDRFESLTVTGETATAVCRMAEAEGTYNMTVTWRFAFSKTADGAWTVEKHTAK